MHKTHGMHGTSCVKDRRLPMQLVPGSGRQLYETLGQRKDELDYPAKKIRETPCRKKRVLYYLRCFENYTLSR